MKNKVIIYYISQILLFTATSLFNPVSYLFYMDNGLNLSVIGVSISILWIVSGIFEIPFGIFTDKYGTKITMILSNVLSICGLGLLIVRTNVPTLLICAAIFGVSTAANSGCLSSWIVNSLKIELKDSFKQEIIQKVFSRSNIFCSIVSLLFSFLMLQIVYEINKNYPIYLSVIAYIICLLFFVFIFNDEYKNFNRKNSNLTNVVTQYFRIIDKKFLFISLFFTIPFIMDMGPVNQRSIVYRKTNILGFIQIIIVGAFVFGNYIVSKTKIKQEKILKLIILDVVIILLLNFFDKKSIYTGIIFFILHVIINTIILGVNISYLHSDIIKDDANRNTSISTFNFLNSCIVGILLIIQGIFSDKIGMTNTWSLFSVIGAVLYIIMFNRIFIKKGLDVTREEGMYE